jgi:phytanoyl-CoA hydroxylase
MAPVATNGDPTAPSGKSRSGSLTPAQLDKYRSDGYLVIPDFFEPAEVLNEARSLIQNFDPTQHPLTKFTTSQSDDDTKKAKHIGDAYFLESGDKIRYFLEEDSIDPKTGKLNRRPDLCVNKCGHALHTLNATFHDLSFSDKVQNLIQSMELFQDPQVLQSMVICKQPSIGAAVPSHNDSTFLYTNPPSATGLWFALEDCTRSNGCLSFLPGSHRWPKDKAELPSQQQSRRPEHDAQDVVERHGVVRGVNKRFVRSEPGQTGSGTTFEVLSDAEEESWDDGRAVVEECKAGESIY